MSEPTPASDDCHGRLTDEAASVAQQDDDLVAPTGRPRLRSDSRLLLGELVRPHKRAIAGRAAHRRGAGRRDHGRSVARRPSRSTVRCRRRCAGTTRA